jgi:uncharacterized membrane protein YqjE
MDDPQPDPGGLLATGKRIVRLLGNLAHSRLDLFLVELKEERIRVFDALLLVVVGVVCAVMALVLFTFTLVVIFWDHSVLVLAVLTLVYGVGASAAFLTLRDRLRRWDSFSATLEQFKKDRACLEKPN